MKVSSLLLSVSLLMFATGCRESEIDQKPAAQVSESTPAAATDATATATQPSAGGVSSKVIKEKSSIRFVGAKVTRDHKGEFKNFDGSIEYVGGKPVNVSFTIDLSSMETDTPKLTQHLKTPDFFDVARYPTATFVSTSLTEGAASGVPGTTHTLKGNLTMRGVTKEITIPVKTAVTPEGTRATSEFTINRHDWGISYRGMADDLIKDEVLIKLDLLFPPPPAA